MSEARLGSPSNVIVPPAPEPSRLSRRSRPDCPAGVDSAGRSIGPVGIDAPRGIARGAAPLRVAGKDLAAIGDLDGDRQIAGQPLAVGRGVTVPLTRPPAFGVTESMRVLVTAGPLKTEFVPR